jgi:alpha-L-rhamnosidase
MWERWDGWTPDNGFQSIEMNSFNHYAFGSVGEYLYRFVAGIDTDGPGFRHITLAPQPRPGLTSAQARFDSPAGVIASAWEVAGGQLRLQVTLPPNTYAAVRVPTRDPASVRLDGQPAQGTAGAGALTISLGSGTYHFEAAAP